MNDEMRWFIFAFTPPLFIRQAKLLSGTTRLSANKRWAILGLLIAASTLMITHWPDSGIKTMPIIGSSAPLFLLGVSLYLWLTWTQHVKQGHS